MYLVSCGGELTKNASANVAATRVRLAANTLKIFLEGVLAAHDSSQPRSRRPSKELNTYRQPATISFDEESHADAQSMAKRRNEDGFFEKIHQMISRIESEMHSFTVQQEKLKNDALEAAPAPEIENKYAYYDDDESEPLNEKEHEKKLLSWNKEVYESRVFKAFVEERLVRALYTQRLHRSSRETFHHHQQVVARNFQWRHSLPTPYTRKVKHEEHTEQVLAHAMEQASLALPRHRSAIAAPERPLVGAAWHVADVIFHRAASIRVRIDTLSAAPAYSHAHESSQSDDVAASRQGDSHATYGAQQAQRERGCQISPNAALHIAQVCSAVFRVKAGEGDCADARVWASCACRARAEASACSAAQHYRRHPHH